MTHAREILTSSKSVEWFTPPEIISRVHRVLGNVDLDPASCAAANQIVGASRFFSKEDDGLKQKWNGKVFINPPYGRVGGQKVWVKRTIEAWTSKEMDEGILLVNSATGNKWFAPLWNFPICFPSSRIKFISEQKESPTHSNAIVYMGGNVESFVRVFSEIGPVAVQVNVIQEQN